MYCLCVNVYCHRVTTQLQLTIISYPIISKPVNDVQLPLKSDKNQDTVHEEQCPFMALVLPMETACCEVRAEAEETVEILNIKCEHGRI